MISDLERHLLLERLRHASIVLHAPSIDPDNIEPERLERICSELRVSNPDKRMEWEMTHHMEI